MASDAEEASQRPLPLLGAGHRSGLCGHTPRAMLDVLGTCMVRIKRTDAHVHNWRAVPPIHPPIDREHDFDGFYFVCTACKMLMRMYAFKGHLGHHLETVHGDVEGVGLGHAFPQPFFPCTHEPLDTVNDHDGCSAGKHHLHIAADEVASWSTGCYRLDCCHCAFGVTVSLRRPNVKSELVAAMQEELRERPQLFVTALEYMIKYLVNAINGNCQPIPLAGKSFNTNLGFLESSTPMFHFFGYTSDASGDHLVPPDTSKYGRRRKLLLSVRGLSAYRDLAVEQMQGLPNQVTVAVPEAPDACPTDATNYVLRLLGARTVNVPHATGVSRSLYAHYDTLGLHPGASDPEVIEAYDLNMAHVCGFPNPSLDLVTALDAVAHVRESDAMRDRVDKAVKTNADVVGSIGRAFTILGISHATDDKTIEYVYQVRASDNPNQIPTLQTALRAVLLTRPDSVDLCAFVAGGFIGDGALDSPVEHQVPRVMTDDERVQEAIRMSLLDTQPPQTDVLGTPAAAEYDQCHDLLSPGAGGVGGFGMLEQPKLREEGMPVGLINFGQTCYFGSLIQALFSVPFFRDTVLAFPGPVTAPDIGEDVADAERKRLHAVRFVSEMRRLFAFMVCGVAKAYRPRALFASLRDDSGRALTVGGQQDVSEFLNIFLRCARRGLAAAGVTADAARILELSTDTTGSDGSESDVDSTIEVLPDTADGAAANVGDEEEMESDTTLEPTCAIETTMYGIEKHTIITGGTEPVAPTTTKFHSIILNVAQGTLHSALLAYVAPQPLPTFRGSDGAATRRTRFEVLPPLLTFHLQRVDFDQGTSKPRKLLDRFQIPLEIAMDEFLESPPVVCEADAAERARLEAQHAALTEQRSLLMDHAGLGHPLSELASAVLQEATSDPGTTDTEALALTTVLSRITAQNAETRREVDRQLAETAAHLAAVRSRVERHTYCLHALLIHSGGASGGHYYAYVRDHTAGRWLCFDDSNVSVVDEESVLRDAQGGRDTHAAYCLMYMRKSLAEGAVVTVTQKPPSQLQVLPPELAEMIRLSNDKLTGQADAWERLTPTADGQGQAFPS